MTQHTN